MIIGICGFKGSGKSEVAKHLASEHSFSHINFKDALIAEMRVKLKRTLQALSEIYELSIDDMFNIKPPAVRSLMQEYGTDIVRGYDEAHWIKEYSKKVSGVARVVTDDVRLHNEYDAVRLANGIIIRVVNDEVTTGGDHESETNHLDFKEDFIVYSKFGDLDGLRKQVDNIIDTLLKNTD